MNYIQYLHQIISFLSTIIPPMMILSAISVGFKSYHFILNNNRSKKSKRFIIDGIIFLIILFGLLFGTLLISPTMCTIPGSADIPTLEDLNQVSLDI